MFIDKGYQIGGDNFAVAYLHPTWDSSSPPPIHHAGGTTLSMADGHAEYWKWKGRETLSGLPRKLIVSSSGVASERIEGGDYEPKTEDGLHDLQRVQRFVWGRLGYGDDESP